jgi:Membrane domain of glycerophosphoryl diester phosphodiesterase
MSNLSPASPLGPLSVGNVVSAGVRIYRSHLKQYLTLALSAFLWFIVPVYGWAKGSEIIAVISKLAYSELINQPETTAEARRHTKPRMWQFLGAGLLVALIFVGVYMAVGIVFAILIGVGTALAFANPGLGIIFALLGLIVLIVALVLMVRLYSRLLVVEVPLAIEDNVDASGAIGRSWELTKGAVGRIQWIVVIAFLLTLLVSIPSQIILSLLQGILGATNEESTTAAAATILALTNLVLTIVSSALITPFWQVIKAVIYYDLRARREGLGLQLRDR